MHRAHHTCVYTSPPHGFQMDSLRLSVLTRCPGSPGCKCREHWGLGDFTLQATGNAHGLPLLQASPEPQNSPLTLIDDECDGTLVCDCSRCQSERAQLLSQPRKEPRQPWEIRRAA